MEVAHKIQESIAGREDRSHGVAEAGRGGSRSRRQGSGKGRQPRNSGNGPATGKPKEPIKAVAGVIHVEAASFAQTGGEISWGGQFPHVLVHDCFTGGKQVYFQQQMKSQWADYTLDVPAAGTYEITMKAAVHQRRPGAGGLFRRQRDGHGPIPLSYGLWQETKPVEIKLEKGMQQCGCSSDHRTQGGIALRWLELKTKE